MAKFKMRIGGSLQGAATLCCDQCASSERSDINTSDFFGLRRRGNHFALSRCSQRSPGDLANRWKIKLGSARWEIAAELTPPPQRVNAIPVRIA